MELFGATRILVPDAGNSIPREGTFHEALFDPGSSRGFGFRNADSRKRASS
jgi:hypothetical protein